MGDIDDGLMDQKGLEEDWTLVESLLPQGWQAKARELGALRRTRGVSDAGVLLRVLLIHLAHGHGLRTTSALARQSGLAQLSDVALLKRLRGCADWFEWMARGLRQRWMPQPPQQQSCWRGRHIRLVDGTMVSEPGPTGSKWRLHYSVTLPDLHCEEVILSGTEQGETLRRFTAHAGDVFIADRGYAHPAGVAHVRTQGGDVVIRTNLVTLPLRDAQGQRVDVLSLLRPLQVGEYADWPVWIKAGHKLLSGRLCAIKKGALAAQQACRRAQRESQRSGTQIRPETLEAAQYVFVFTTLGTEVDAANVLELYRGRWQIELAFKRLKSLVQLGHLKKNDAQASRAWLQGKLLVALLLDALLQTAQRISPWGHPNSALTQPMPVA
jgi:Transposase DDE domain